MAIPKGIQKILIGVTVKTKKPIRWHELVIPIGARGVIKKVESGGTVAIVQFDDGRKYGTFECWFSELGPG